MPGTVFSAFGRNSLRLALLASACMVMPAYAQTAETAPDPAQADGAAPQDAEQAIIVTGARAEQRSSIDVKRNADVVLDGIVNDEIGALPDNSVGDTLERITGVSADRFKGNANELSVRGLGPTLSFSTFNGREVSTAGADRSVAFQQFPSELVNGVIVYKTQRADFLEGGIAGVIELRSMRPLDYGKSRFQAEIRGSYLPKDDKIIGRDGLGYRANASLVKQFRTGIGEIGIAIGYQRQDVAAPEDYYNGNSNFVPCNTSASNGTLISTNTAANNAAGAAVNCQVGAAPRTGIGETIGTTYYATQSRSFRQQDTRELRNAVIGALQWRPAPNLDISLDGQWSKRESTENRNILSIAEALRGIKPIIIGDGSNGFSKGALIKYSGNSNIENQLELRERNETYKGGGATVTWKPGNFVITADGSFSDSHRTETQKATRMRSTTRVGYELDYSESPIVPRVTFFNFDVNNPANFAANTATSVYARQRFVTDRKDDIWAGRLDAEYRFANDGFIKSIKAGGRYSEHQRTLDNNRNTDLNTIVPYGGMTVAQIIGSANANCRRGFPTSEYFPTTNTNLSSWATFDNQCLFKTFTGQDSLALPADSRDPSDIDVTEKIRAAYAMASFGGELGSTPFSGNIGLRYVKTSITSVGFRLPFKVTIDTASDNYTVAADPNGTIQTDTLKGEYEYWLPSLNLAFDLSSKIKLRAAGYRALSRSPIESFGAGINLNPTSGSGGASSVTFNPTSGNPNLKPMRAWNADLSLEFYPSRDTLFSIAGYYKWLRGSVISRSAGIPTTISVTTQVDNGAPTQQSYNVNLIAPANDPEMRHLYGVEFTGSHAFTWLPGILSGFGINGSVNIALANFQYPDTSALAPYLDPENLIGLSKYVANGTVYWERKGFSLRAMYRYRSHYYKPNSGTNRGVQDAGYLNLSVQYDVTKNVQLKLQALNVTNTKDVFYKGGYDSIAEVSESGPQYYFGVRIRY
ncbi:MAG: TonB-dependent receptor [Sphingomonas sp.]|uniref:TonB-dependent receptor n=1 Tax=unclassified Sphingomonas TaxID=196159 RepID=UPI0024590136|nr:MULTISPECIES: TonB-dependent receptor [unclassified Sphingomonas]MBQ1500491.1 TonB-dependent receptor [Sphingomonas sp.]MDH4745640.1 TonB-dependent receptor [Sphingomonas sp. CBMAI 2297]